MQDNSLIRVFGILFGLVSLYQLSFTFIASQQEEKAANFAEITISEDTDNYLELRDRQTINYLDSIETYPSMASLPTMMQREKNLTKGWILKEGLMLFFRSLFVIS